MSKNLIYLISFILVLGLAPSVESADPYQQEAGPDGIVSMEAENFDENTPQGSHTWDFVTDPAGFSGTGAMRAMPNDGTLINEPGQFLVQCPRLDFEVNFTKSGTHYIWVRCRQLDDDTNTIHVGINGTHNPTSDRVGNLQTFNEWVWASTSELDGSERLTIDIPDPGVHTINVWMRESGYWFDKIVLTTDPDYTPTDEGPYESSRGPRFKAYRPIPKNGELYEDTWASLSWSVGDTAVSHDIYIGENLNDVNDGTGDTFRINQAGTFYIAGFPGYPYPDGLIPSTTYYWRIDEVETDGTTIYKGDVWSFSIPPQNAYSPDPANGAEKVDPDVEVSWTPGFNSKLHTVYFGENFDDVNNAAGGLPQGPATYTPGTLKLAKTYYWRVDEFDVVDTHKGDVWSFTTEGGVWGPNPANGAVDVKQTPILTWTPGVYAASHQVYFGNDHEAVRNADTGSPEYKGTGDLGAESYDPGKLQWDTTYYWRIDEANNVNPDSPWAGPVWSFTTADFLLVDDFESYNDIDPPEAGSNRIFEAWPDGYDIPTNGALVGNDLPPYAEQTIVHGGNQSMPLYYDNSVGYSEATLTLTYPRDWTEKGVNTLTIWFRGDSANAAETLYVVLNDSAVVNHDNPNAAQITTWTEWNIDLQGFADQGVNLANVNTIALGLGNRNNPVAGGSGTMYFDDIRLYPPPPEPAP